MKTLILTVALFLAFAGCATTKEDKLGRNSDINQISNTQFINGVQSQTIRARGWDF